MEKDTKNKIKNYKFSVDYDKDNNILFNYVLEKGVSYQYIALELLKNNGFDEKIIKDKKFLKLFLEKNKEIELV